MSANDKNKAAAELSPLKRALLAIERLQARIDELEGGVHEPVAVIGIGCRFPGGVDDAEGYFDFLRDGGDAVIERPPVDRPGWPETDPDSGDFPFPPAGYLDVDVGGFDPVFFGISPREAASIDPQQRLLLEVAWESLEDAAIDPHALEGTRAGVFVGITGTDYAQLQMRSERAEELLHSHFASGIGQSMASGRLAYLLGLQGPAITVDTACSSSLVSLHLACQSLRIGDSDLAISGGTNLILSGDLTRAFSSSQMLSPDGRCKTFDAAADGFGRGEGCGVVVLKRLADARRDGDRILAVIRASAVNQDGASSGLTAPNGAAQEAVIRAALRQAGLRPADIDYVEAHGTGTSLGDPIEVQALGSVFAGRDDGRHLPIGSVKTNFGHLEASAGIAGLIKIIQVVRHREIPPHRHFESPSPHIPWSELPLEVPTAAVRFDDDARPLRAAVSSFGFSGTNAHVIVEEAFPDVVSPVNWDAASATEARETSAVPGRDATADAAAPSPDRPGGGVAVLPISAPTAEGLNALARRYADDFGRNPHAFADICHTAGVGRAHFSHRLTLVAADAESARAQLSAWLEDGASPQVATNHLDGPDEPTLAFFFTGQGAQYPGMGKKLADASPRARRALEACEEILAPQLDVRLSDVIGATGEHSDLIHRTDYTQPALFALQYALVQHWQGLGIQPAVVAGHSIGEFVAAHLAGTFSLEDALRAVVARGRVMHAVAAEGRMLALMAREETVLELLEGTGDEVAVAAVNAPAQIVVSGAAGAIEAVARAARAAGIDAKPLRTSQAFHSPLMDPAVTAFETELADLELQPAGRLRFVSTVTGAAVRPEDLADPGYWARQLRSTVRFTDAVAAVAGVADRGVEIGPHPSLCGLVGQGDVEFPMHASLHRERDARESLLGALADLYRSGVTVDWRGLDADGRRRRVSLPRYPFQRSRLWVDLGSGGRDAGDATSHRLLGREIRQPGSARTFQSTLRADRPRFIEDHRVLGEPILPGTALVELLQAAAERTVHDAPVLADVLFREPVSFADGSRRIHVTARVESDGRQIVEVHSAPDRGAGEWTLHATARVDGLPDGGASASQNDGTFPVPDAPGAAADSDAAGVERDDADAVTAADFYEGLEARGYEFGPRLRGVEKIWVGDEQALARISLPAACADEAGDDLARPLLLDAALQVVGPALGDDGLDGTYLPVGIERVSSSATLPHAAWVRARIRSRRDRAISADVTIVDDGGRLLAALSGVDFRAVSRAALSGDAAALSTLRWEPLEDAETDPTTTPTDYEQLTARVATTLAGRAGAGQVSAYDAYVADLEARSADYVLRAMAELGWRPEVGEQIVVGALAERLGIVDDRRRLFRRALRVLGEEGFLVPDGDGWRVSRQLDVPVAEPERPASNTPPERAMLERCGPYLADNLRGVGDPLELLFPKGDARVAEQMYYDTPLARVLNGTIADTVATAWQAASPSRPFRVLEIGAGTAGTTRRVMDRIAEMAGDRRAAFEYTFTDVSPLFVERARGRFEGRDEMSFAVFDLDASSCEQGLAAGHYDVVIAANCLHAARDLEAALANARRLLRPGGWLIGAEVFAPHRWFDLTVGLTDGWWHFTDDGLRTDYACLPADLWESVLERAGFGAPQALVLADHDEAEGIASRGQGLVTARNPSAPSSLSGHGRGWLVVGDASGLAGLVHDAMADAGVETRLLPSSAIPAQADSSSPLSAALAEKPWDGILHCAAVHGARDLTPSGIEDRLATGVRSLLNVVRAAGGADGATVERLAVVTRGGQSTGVHDADVDPSAAAVWGLARTVALEIPELACRSIDLDPVVAPDDAARVLSWLANDTSEPEIAVRRGVRLAPRLDRWQPTDDAGAALPREYRLEAGARDSLDDLAFSAGQRRAPAEHEVEIRVAATGLNFKDVLGVLGMYPGDPGPLGSECAGVVTRVGAASSWRPGDEVIAAAGHAFGRHVVADSRLVAAKPEGLTFAEAATLPVAYLTAYFALHHLGNIGPGDRVLIHAAAGGVGSAACELARRAGAEIFATAGSEAKRELLRAGGLRHVFDSRSDVFAGQIMEATDGAGVTMVLNSLAGDLVDAGFSVIAAGGRFLEIGKRGIWTHQQVAALGRDIDYHVIDWGETFGEDPELMANLLGEVMAAVDDGSLAPLPATRFLLEEVVDAFRFMQQAKHVGKVVLQHPVQRADDVLSLRRDAAYLITGGTSGLGLETAAWAADRGAGTLVLASRNAPDDSADQRLTALRDRGVEVHVRRLDVGDATQWEAFAAWAADELDRPLRGVFHSAGALADRTLQHLTWEDFEAVFRSKVRGSARLAAALPAHSTDFFVAYSSIAGVFGSPGQANHAAANAFLDAFAATGWAWSGTGVSLSWGPWSDTGAAARDDVLERTSRLGIGALTTSQGLACIDAAFRTPEPLLVATRIESPEALGNARGSALVARLLERQQERTATPRPAATEESLIARLAAAPAGARRGVLSSHVRERVRGVLALPADLSVEDHRPLGELGLDSLLAVELRNVLGADLGVRLPATTLFDYPTPQALCDHLLTLTELDDGGGEGAGGRQTPDEGPADALRSVEELSEEEVDRLLAERLHSHE